MDLNMFFDILPQDFLLLLLFVNFVFIITLFIINLSNRKNIRKLNNKYNAFMSGISSDGKNIEQLLESCLDKINSVKNTTKELDNRLRATEKNILGCVQKVGVVRYNAFENVGSDLSFAVALLDNYNTGVVFSGIYSRDNSATYAKQVIEGVSKYALSEEELKALDIAKKHQLQNK
jgi:hypothetical protein